MQRRVIRRPRRLVRWEDRHAMQIEVEVEIEDVPAMDVIEDAPAIEEIVVEDVPAEETVEEEVVPVLPTTGGEVSIVGGGSLVEEEVPLTGQPNLPLAQIRNNPPAVLSLPAVVTERSEDLVQETQHDSSYVDVESPPASPAVKTATKRRKKKRLTLKKSYGRAIPSGK